MYLFIHEDKFFILKLGVCVSNHLDHSKIRFADVDKFKAG